MIIDGHAHACGIYATEEAILENIKLQRVDKIILSAGEYNSTANYSIPNLSKLFKTSTLPYKTNKFIHKVVTRTNAVEHLESENERVAKMAQKYPDQIGNTYWVNINDPQCVHKLEQFIEVYPLSMIKMHQCWTPFDMRDEKVQQIIQLAMKIKKPLFIHLDSKEQVKAFKEIAEKNREATFIVAHLIGIEVFDQTLKNPNVYFDLSCPELHSIPMLERAYHCFGAERLLLGSDTPYGKDNIKKVLKQLEEISLTQEEKDLVCYKNIMRLLN